MKIAAFKAKLVSSVIKALIITGSVFLLVAAYALMTTRTVSATPTDLGNARSKYPSISGTRLDTCTLCHTGSIPDLNPYGAAYLANGRNNAAFGLIESIDSDGDGFTNLQEITALTFPGDPADHPVANTPTATSAPPTPTRTPTATSLPPTATNTPTPTTVGNPPPTATPTQVNTATPVPSATPTLGPPLPSPTTTIGPSPTPRVCKDDDRRGDDCEKEREHHKHKKHHHRHYRRRR